MEEEKKKVNLYKLFSNISIFLTIGLVAILILMITNFIKANSVLIELIFVLLVLSITCTVSLTWIQKIMRGRYKVLSWVMIGVLAAFAILWIVTIFVTANFIKTIGGVADAEATTKIGNFVTFIQIVLIASLQFILGSFVANAITTFGKSNILLQCINYLSAVMIDVWFCKFLTIINFSKSGEFQLNDANFLKSSGWWALFLISAAVLAITNSSISRIAKKKKQETEREIFADNGKKETSIENKQLEKKLAKLNQLKESGVITEEEYKQKRKEIIDKL